MKKGLSFLVIFLITTTFLIGCSTKVLKESDVLFADEMVENVLIAHNNNDYEMWKKDMDQVMINAIPTKEKFEEGFKQIKDKIGDYIPKSKTFLAADSQKGIIVVQYMAKFTNEEQVKLTFSFKDVNGAKKIVGEFFDSEKLRKK